MATPSTVDFDLYQGETLDDHTFAVTNPDGTVYDLTGCSAELYVTGGDGVTPVLDWTSAGGTLTIAAAAGTIRIPMSAATSAALAAQSATYRLYVTFADGTRHCLWRGAFRVRAK